MTGAEIRILNVFDEQLNKMDFTKVKVSEIVRLANINRSTFYDYFEDKYVLLSAYLQKKIKEQFSDSMDLNNKDYEQRYKIILKVLNYLLNNKKYLTLLVNHIGKDRMYTFFETAMYEVYFDTLKKDTNKVENKIEFYSRYSASGFVGVLYWWLFEENTITKEQVAENLCDLYTSTKHIKPYIIKEKTPSEN